MKVSNKIDNGELVIEMRFDAHDQLCLNHDLMDIVDWYVSGPSQQKIYNCRDRMIRDNKDALMASSEMSSMTMKEANAMLNDPVACVFAIAKMSSYKNRRQREEDSK